MRKIKRSLALILAMVTLIVSALPVMASEGFDETYYRVSDSYGIISDSERETLEDKALSIRSKYNVDVAITIVNGMPEGYTNVVNFADDVYELAGFGYGSSHDGVMLLVDMSNRKWCISTEGYGLTAFTDYGCDYIGEQVKELLKDEKYYKALDKFLDLSDQFIAEAKNGKPYDTNHKIKSSLNLPKTIIISLGIGLVVGLIVVLALASQLKSVKMQDSAKYYTKPGSMHLRDQRDIFLFHTISKTVRQSSKSGGGSSSHFSSSGRSHGGSSGSF